MQNAQSVYLDTIKSLVEENEIEKALDALRELDKQTGADIWQDLALLYSNFRSSAKAQREGRIAYEEYRRYEAQTLYAVLDLMKEIPRRVEQNAKTRTLDGFQFQVPAPARIEKIIGSQNSTLKLNWLEKALHTSRAVCRVVCADGGMGTGFLTQGGYLFTCNHILPSPEAASGARVEFNYDLEADGSVKNRTTYLLDASDYLGSPLGNLDFVRVRVLDRPEAPLSQWGFLEFAAETVPIVGEALTLIQHPNGQDKQIALHDNQVVGQLRQYLFYSADTEPGSSGAPVFNKDWKVAAIHHAKVTGVHGIPDGSKRGILSRDIWAYLSGRPLDHDAVPQQPNTQQPATQPHSNPTISSPSTLPPTPSTSLPPKFVVIYDIADDAQCKALNKHLNILKITKKVRVYNVHEALPGEDLVLRANTEIEGAAWVLALVTVDLLNSPDWFGMVYAAHEAGRRIIPIRVGKADFEGTGLEKLRSLPTQNRTVADFATPDAAYADIAAELKKLL